MKDNLIYNLKYRHSIVKYANKYGVTRASMNYNVSRSFIYKLLNRFDGSLDSLKPLSRRPLSHPNAQTNDELNLIKNYLRRTPDISLVVLWVRLTRRGYTRSITTLYRTLVRLGLRTNPPKPPKNKPKLYDPTTFPGERIQIDVKFVPSDSIVSNQYDSKYYQYTAIDEFTRYRVIKIYDELSTYSSKLFLEHIIKKFPFEIKCVQTDNGTEFTNKYLSDNPKPSLFESKLASLQISHKLIKPYTPRHNGKVERSHRKDKNWFYTRKFIDIDDLKNQLSIYLREYNNFPMRPLGWLSPIEFLKKFNMREAD